MGIKVKVLFYVIAIVALATLAILATTANRIEHLAELKTKLQTQEAIVAKAKNTIARLDAETELRAESTVDVFLTFDDQRAAESHLQTIILEVLSQQTLDPNSVRHINLPQEAGLRRQGLEIETEGSYENILGVLQIFEEFAPPIATSQLLIRPNSIALDTNTPSPVLARFVAWFYWNPAGELAR